MSIVHFILDKLTKQNISFILFGLLMIIAPVFHFLGFLAMVVVGFGFSTILLLYQQYKLWQEDQPTNFYVRTIAHISLWIVTNSLLTIILLGGVLPSLFAVFIPAALVIQVMLPVMALAIVVCIASIFYMGNSNSIGDSSEERRREASSCKDAFIAAMERGDDYEIKDEDLQGVVSIYINDGGLCSLCQSAPEEGDSVILEYDSDHVFNQRKLYAPGFITHQNCYHQMINSNGHGHGLLGLPATSLTLFTDVICPSLQPVPASRKASEVSVIVKDESRRSICDSNHIILFAAVPRGGCSSRASISQHPDSNDRIQPVV